MDKNSSYFNALQIERKVMRLILFIVVAIATLNIISALVMLVKNKSRDIAILRTIGASQASILRIFMMAGASIGLAGTLAGLLLGVLFCANITAIQSFVEWVTGAAVFSADIYFLAHIPAKIDWSEVGVIVGISTALSILATLLPAISASHIDPVEALRYE
jgi:lipoprotein-releasing system permease protein